MGECYSKKSVAPGSETLERISTTSTSSESNMQQRNKKPKESLETGQMAFTLAQLEALEICLKEAEEKAKSLSEQLAASEGTKAKLLEQVSWLEEKLETLNHKEDSGEPYEKMVLAKDQCIEKLQAEVKASQEQLTAHQDSTAFLCSEEGLCVEGK
uniref:Coiled-coil domain containing 192 n=1 Tax=Mustela putorius furo TaxID=9669 RepID=M3YKD1_MUSPF